MVNVIWSLWDKRVANSTGLSSGRVNYNVDQLGSVGIEDCRSDAGSRVHRAGTPAALPPLPWPPLIFVAAGVAVPGSLSIPHCSPPGFLGLSTTSCHPMISNTPWLLFG